MKIAIFTLPLHCNYGGILQAYALQTVLQRMGHRVFLYDTPFAGERKPVKAASPWRTLLRHLLPPGREVLPRRVKPRIPKRELHCRRHLARFFDEHFFLRPLCGGKEDLEAVVVGSDQVWRPLYFPSIELAFLSFAEEWKNVRRVAYACSFGTDRPEYSAGQIERCGRLVGRFDGVSVREASMVPIIRDTFRWNCRPALVLDPTLLLEPDDYRRLYRPYSPDCGHGRGNRLFCYFLDPNETKEGIRLQILNRTNQTELKQADLSPAADGLEAGDYASPESWLHAFDAADAVLTDSFHGCVFSILFNKPFVVVGNAERGMARFRSLLGLFGLESRLVDPAQGFDPELPAQPIDWAAVNGKLHTMRGESLAFLKRHLPPVSSDSER